MILECKFFFTNVKLIYLYREDWLFKFFVEKRTSLAFIGLFFMIKNLLIRK